MPEKSKDIRIALESTKRRTFAIAYDWPGWARSGKDEDGAIHALQSYGERYANVFKGTPYSLKPPGDENSFKVIERLEGNSTTAFGAPALPLMGDDDMVGDDELDRYQAMLQASWSAFDQALSASKGIALRLGPRGGGRDQEKILAHVVMADESYLSKLGWSYAKNASLPPSEKLMPIRQTIQDGLAAAVRGEIPAKGPRGGVRWTARYFVRRVIWHILDHAWEIEDRLE